MSGSENEAHKSIVKHTKKHRKDKPWDAAHIDHWKVEVHSFDIHMFAT